MADQMEPIDVEFLMIVFLEITGQQLAIWPSITQACSLFVEQYGGLLQVLKNRQW